jgi:CPA2 family monovalent cation:H+ antiporter-2
MAGSILQDALIYLGSALVFVPLAKRLGIGSVLGYILAGVAIGPFVLGLVGAEGQDVMHTAEFGVVMMLFIIGLELSPQAFWKMKNTILSMGGLQMGVTAVALFPVFYFLFSSTWNVSLALALSFTMSSTAIVFQTLKEKGLEKTRAGEASFAVLLFQDVAVIPLLALLPLLALGSGSTTEVVYHSDWEAWVGRYPSLAILGGVAVIFLVSRYGIQPFLYFISRTRVRELLTASALFIVIGVAWLMMQVGVSAALGAFLAGVLLANSEFRHQLESDVEPFKGVLLGIFFTAVGSTINFSVVANRGEEVLLAVVCIMLLKAVVLGGVARVFKMGQQQGWLLALLLSQAGEFVFVLLGSARALSILNTTDGDFYMAVVAISMVVSPVLLFVYERFGERLFMGKQEEETVYQVNGVEHHKIILAGFGHFGSSLGRFLRANGVEATILDSDSDRVNLLRKMGFKVFFGDATRVDLLEAAGASKAEIFISAIDSASVNVELAELVKEHFPHLKLYIRAKNRADAYELMELDVKHVYRETIHSSVFMGVDVLTALGFRAYTSKRKANDFIRYDTAALEKLGKERKNHATYVLRVKEEIEMQERLLREDVKFTESNADNAWDNSPLRT